MNKTQEIWKRIYGDGRFIQFNWNIKYKKNPPVVFSHFKDNKMFIDVDGVDWFINPDEGKWVVTSKSTTEKLKINSYLGVKGYERMNIYNKKGVGI